MRSPHNGFIKSPLCQPGYMGTKLDILESELGYLGMGGGRQLKPKYAKCG